MRPDRLCLPEKTELANESAFSGICAWGAEKQPEHLHRGRSSGPYVLSHVVLLELNCVRYQPGRSVALAPLVTNASLCA